ncbi:hypothetical protein RhiirA4_422135 [Rhizophagus irregularis]|uniref:Uncharacterized protein n=1 Tax=Rhizophagus irregularis TaxID=588596 RepID=A0A2I1GP29_9GLOM|nr:hypothetical protein RhiirA4_422135 [Rhizophagus irregularis]
MMITTENWRLFQEVSDLHAKCLQLERRNNELTKHTAVVATEIACLREDNEFLSGVNAEFGSENNDLKEEKKLRRIKAAKDLYRKSNKRIIGYEKCQLLKMLANRAYHLPELKNLLQNVIDSHSAEIQMAKLQQPRQYAPQWSYVEQEDFIYDIKIDSRSSFDEDEDYGEKMEEVLIDSQKSAAGDDLVE